MSALSSWLRLQTSTQSGGLWTVWDAVAGDNDATQADVDRQPTVAASANGLPLATFDATSDVMPWPLSAANNSTTKIGMMMWVNPAIVTGEHRLAVIWDGTGGASIATWLFQQNDTTLNFITGITGITCGVAGAFTLNTPACVGFEFNGAATGDANRLVLTLNGVAQSVSFSGSVPATVSNATGNMMIGGFQNTDTPGQVFNGKIGPNVFMFNNSMAGVSSGLLTAAARLALAAFERPT